MKINHIKITNHGSTQAVLLDNRVIVTVDPDDRENIDTIEKVIDNLKHIDGVDPEVNIVEFAPDNQDWVWTEIVSTLLAQKRLFPSATSENEVNILVRGGLVSTVVGTPGITVKVFDLDMPDYSEDEEMDDLARQRDEWDAIAAKADSDDHSIDYLL